MTDTRKRYGRPKVRPDDGRGGERPNSGALKNRFVLYSFAHNERGATMSKALVIFRRCNSCGATGIEVVSEYLVDNLLNAQVHNTQEQPLVHSDGCTMK